MDTEPSRAREDRPSIVGTGLLALDVVISDDDCSSPRRWAGGTCGNVLIILSYLDWDAYPVGRLDSEAASKRILADMARWGVHLDFATSEPQCNAPIIIHKIFRTPGGEALHKFSMKCPHCGAWLPGYKAVVSSAAQHVAARIGSPRVFFLDRVSRGSLLLAKASSERGALVVFEPSGIQDPRLFREALSLTHILKYSTDRIHDLREWKSSTTPLLEIETLGRKGLRYRSRIESSKTTGWQRLEPYSATRVTDTAGSGDWCTAGIVHCLGRQGLAGLHTTTATELREALRFGQALAAWNCRFEGARGGMYEVDRLSFQTGVMEIMCKGKPRTGNTLALHLNRLRVQSGNRPRTEVGIARTSPPSQAQDACCF
jgi:sugar/nucleoside kinase (ribokinase family)